MEEVYSSIKFVYQEDPYFIEAYKKTNQTVDYFSVFATNNDVFDIGVYIHIADKLINPIPRKIAKILSK